MREGCHGPPSLQFSGRHRKRIYKNPEDDLCDLHARRTLFTARRMKREARWVRWREHCKEDGGRVKNLVALIHKCCVGPACKAHVFGIKVGLIFQNSSAFLTRSLMRKLSPTCENSTFAASRSKYCGHPTHFPRFTLTTVRFIHGQRVLTFRPRGRKGPGSTRGNPSPGAAPCPHGPTTSSESASPRSVCPHTPPERATHAGPHTPGNHQNWW